MFRFALERWTPAPYQVFVFQAGKLDAEQRGLVESLRRQNASGGGAANFEVKQIMLPDDRDKLDGGARILFDAQQNPTLPWVVVRYPAALGLDATVWAGKLSDAASVLADSPVRKELIRRLTKGDTAVWLLLESGDPAQDEAAAARLAEELPRVQAELKIPQQDPADYLTNQPVPLKIEFSTLRLARDDRSETFLVSALLHSEDDLAATKGPIVFPVFGRGRTLWGMVGKGINLENLEHAGAFMTGACACEIKDANPGFDLLLAAHWDALLEHHLVVQTRPDVGGLADFLPPPARSAPLDAVAGDAAKESTGAASSTDAAAGTGQLTPNGVTGAEISATDRAAQVRRADYPPLEDRANRAGSAVPAGAAATAPAGGSSSLLRNVIVVVIGGLVLVSALTVIFFRR
ncbi:MAG TPA: hypothetical protein VFE24_07570 [Pirellulales bacterium]|nr:hypothetical protein [Pirellulales bacterium]